jgi:predicted RNA methylase
MNPACNGISRLLNLRQDNNLAGELMRLEAPRFQQIAERHLNGTAPKAVTGFNLFQTPKIIAARMADLIAERIKGGRILEPSAGLGRLVNAMDEKLMAEWVMVEEARECFNALSKAIKRAGRMENRDFLGTSAQDLGGGFDAVIMNPPFKQGTDIRHIRHALDMLKPGGRLVSLCYNGTKQNEQLKPIADQWEVLPEASFKDEGTAASVALIVIDKV